LKFNDKIEAFNDEIVCNFLCNKEVISWKSYFFERRNDNFWTIVVEYKHTASQPEALPGKTREKRDETYKDPLAENDWPLSPCQFIIAPEVYFLRIIRPCKSNDQALIPCLFMTGQSDKAMIFKNPTDSCICLGANASYTNTKDKNGFIGFQFIEVEFRRDGLEVKAWPYRLRTGGRVRFAPDEHRWEGQDGPHFQETIKHQKEIIYLAPYPFQDNH
jgi:hypothetical protein